MAEPLALVLESSISEIPQMNEILAGYLSSHGIPEEDILDMQLAVEEAVTNIIRHGYHGGPGEIRITCTVHSDSIETVIRDEAIPFNPLLLPPPDIDTDTMDRPIGGLGVMLIRNLMQDVRYRFEEPHNILTLIRERKSPQDIPD